MISAKIIADSVGPSKVRLTTFVLTYPRFIHSEFMTHRMLSKNAASSRAIPCKKMRAMVLKEPAMPCSFSKNQAGMQAAGDISPRKQAFATDLWRIAGIVMCGFHFILEKLGVHKQHANRILEPWLHMTIVTTGTDWENFFTLRCHFMAQPEFQELAKAMFRVYSESTPQKLKAGEWHLPFINILEYVGYFGMDPEEQKIRWKEHIDTLIKKSVARCARVSYLSHEGKNPTQSEDMALYARLLGSMPIHASPAEHQAMATRNKGYSGNLRGWIQFRKTLKGENVTKLPDDLSGRSEK
jgi:thymidylate synthase ThyX